MASFDGITAAKADEILGMSVVSGAVNPSGHLILTRQNGQTIDAGDFTAIVTDILDDTVNAQVSASVPNAVAGTVFNKGNLTGALTFPELNNINMINALITGTLTGNITIATTALPANPKPNTQFAMRLTQPASGGKTLTLGSGFKKSQGVLPLTLTANAIDLLVFIYDGAQWYAGMMGADLK